MRNHIRMILKEETNLPLKFRRRISFIDSELEYQMNKFYRPDKICIYKNDEKFLEVVVETVIDSTYYDHFSDIDDYSKEWAEIYYSIVDYITKKYGEELKKYYHINRGN